MSDEYIKTLEIRAQTGDAEAVKAYKNAIAHRESVQKATQKFASNLRSEGTDIRYRPDGSIEFDLDQQTNSQKTMTQTAAQRKDERKRKFRVWQGKEKPTDTGNPQQSKEQQEEEEGSGWSPLLLIYSFLLASLLLLALFWNVQPFVTFVKIIASRVDFAEISRFLFSLPGIGGAFQFVANFYAALLGSLLYIIFQGLELAPYLYKRNPAKSRKIIADCAQWATFRVTKKDPRAVRSLKRTYNEHPIRTYKTLSTTRSIIYFLEVAICFMAEPPVADGNPFTFLWYLVTFQLGKIDWINVLLILSVLFLVDIIVRLILSVYPEVFPKRGTENHARL